MLLQQHTRSDQRQRWDLSSAGLAVKVIAPNGDNQATASRERSLQKFIELLQTKNSQAVGNHRAPPRHALKRWLQKQGVMQTDTQTGRRASWWGEEQEKREKNQKMLPHHCLSTRIWGRGDLFVLSASEMLR